MSIEGQSPKIEKAPTEPAQEVPPPPGSFEPVITSKTPEEIKAAEAALEGARASNEKSASSETMSGEIVIPSTATGEEVEAIKALGDEKRSSTTKKATLGLLGGTGVFLAFFAALFASGFEKLGKAMGIKFEGGGKGGGGAKPAGGGSGGHH